jgi:signal transduction histidine kinase
MTSVKEDLDQRLAFLALTGEDQRCLQELRPLLEQHADTLVGAFYRHLLSFEPTRALLRDPAMKERLLQKQRDYLLSLAGASLDEQYVAERARIGERHMEVGLEPRWYLGAYALYFSLLTPVIFEGTREDPVRGERAVTALLKVLMLDAQIAMETYIEKRERELEYLNQELASMGRELARDYEEQSVELRQTTRRAQVAEQLASIATLVAGLAHEIGTPMSVIRGHAELLESSVSDARSRWRAQAIREQIDRISGIIQTLLNMAKPREPVRIEVDLRTLIDDTLGFLGEKFRRRSIVAERQLKTVPTLYGDPDRLQQLFLNLFLNAADAMPQGGTLQVSLKPVGNNGVEVRVADTGSGIPPEKLAQIFDPFFTTKTAGQGHGLGLVVAKTIVLDHEGSVNVRSELGRGTEFQITLTGGKPQSEVPDEPAT